ncbi:MAG: uracil-DNA glycosylase [Campylobacterales bacterium]|nr:uracil-DNA glycosylase [Campylobacterales bacterium]
MTLLIRIIWVQSKALNGVTMQSWKEIIEQEKSKAYYQKLKEEIDKRYAATTVYPPKDKIFAAFGKTPTQILKVVILGQDPYHGEAQAQGLAFSTPATIPNPPSMVNILKEIESDIGAISICYDGELTPWANQGVLLLNTILTVEANKAKSHHNLGWEIFTDNIISHISQNFHNIIFLLWGSNAISKSKLIDTTRHHILSAPHPSPLSAYRGFFGCRHFSKTNEILKALGKEAIVW